MLELGASGLIFTVHSSLCNVAKLKAVRKAVDLDAVFQILRLDYFKIESLG